MYFVQSPSNMCQTKMRNMQLFGALVAVYLAKIHIYKN